METFRKIMAVPMAAAVIWLGWVLSKQIDFFGMLVVVCGLGATAVFLLAPPDASSGGSGATGPGHGCHGDSRGGFRHGGEPRDVRAC